MAENSPGEKPSEGKAGAEDAPKKPKKEKVSIDPAQRGPASFNRSQLRGKSPITRKPKKAGR